MTAEHDLIRATLSRSPLLSELQPGNIEKVAGTVRLIRVKAGDIIVEADQPSDAFYLVAEGEVSVLASTTSPYELCRLSPPESFGELGLLLETPRSATVRAATDVALLVFEANVFKQLYSKVPDFGVAICSNLAQRLQQTSRLVEHPSFGRDGELPSVEVMNLLPVAFMMRHRVLPLHTEGQNIALGCVEEPSASVLQGIAQLVPGMEVGCVSIHSGLFDRAMKSLSGTQAPTSAAEGPTLGGTDALDHLLRRVVEEGASDLHLSAGHRPRWRIDGEMIELVDTGVLNGDAVFDMIRPKMREDSIVEFEATNDCDFAYAIEGLARFRVNIFRDRLGAGAVLRQIPDKILTIEQLGLPQAVIDLCNHSKGLILVTGPTGSGKSTTLAAIVDRINKERSAHILTLEDPIEFVHQSHKSLVNQREVGVHTESFARALKAALREDPDIIMVGEMRDIETVALALETANTGHLVFGTLHTSTAVGTVDRIVDLFPSEQQAQIRSGLAETLLGVVAQTLCKKIGGGRVAAIELLIGTHAVSNLIREGKTHQIPNIMVTGRAAGNQLLNYELKRLVDSNVVSKEEAMGKAVDKKELAKMLGVSV